MVFVKLQPYRQVTLRAHRHQKLGLRYFGPFPIVERVGKVAYRLFLPPSARIHDVFHVSILKKCIGEPNQQYFPLPLTIAEDESLPIPVQVLDFHRILQQGNWVAQVLVQWSNFPTQDSTWEFIVDM
uniref:Tf2-1-like SH3-like domain-containing protein n=2 Tax=Cajanus cajan TaxID=3821 RepID=A0A151QNQ8_CAJCA|nr:hypothetical protein KK1_047512 [Cajanus cajan]